MTRNGTLIVIDGNDGTGKATQTKLLAKRLRKDGLKVEIIEFPQYKNFFGSLIGECLAGKHGDFLKIDPHIASVLYAADRLESKTKIEKWLGEGKVVISDRYVSANQIHQGAKIENVAMRKRFLTWVETMEYKVFKMHRPAGVIYLHLPATLSAELIKARGTADFAERSHRHLAAAERTGLELAHAYKWKKIDCFGERGVLPRDEIHQKVYECAKKIIRL